LESTLSRPEAAVNEQPVKPEIPAIKTRRLSQQSQFWLMEAMAQRGESAAFLHWLGSEGAKHG